MSRTTILLLVGSALLGATLYVSWADEPAKTESPAKSESLSARLGKKRGSFWTVLDCGAKGDGQTDDSAAIQDLIDSQGGSIRFPAGAYRITRPLVVNLDKTGFTSFISDG